MLPRVPRELRVAFVSKMVGVLVDYGLQDIEEPDYIVLSEELCETIRTRSERDATVVLPC